MEDGLPSNHVSAICQDTKGYMWFGTSDGLSVFDGVGFRNITTQQGLPGNYISSIVEDRLVPGTMWLLCREALVRLAGDSVQTFDQGGRGVRSMHQDRSGIVWCTADSGVLRIEGGRLLPMNESMLESPVFGIGESSDSVLWFIMETRLVRKSLGTGELREFALPAKRNRQLWDLLGDREGNLWMSAEKVFRIRDTGIVEARDFKLASSWLTGDRLGNLWFAGYGGLGKIPKDRFAQGEPVWYAPDNGLVDGYIRTIFVDRENNLWVGGRDRGVSMLPHGSVMKFPIGTVWNDYHHRIATSDRRGHIWLISDNTLLEFWRDDHGRWGRHAHILPLGERSGYDIDFGSVFADHKGDLWVTGYFLDKIAFRFAIVPGVNPNGAADSGHSTLRLKQAIPSPIPKIRSFTLSLIVDRTGKLWISVGYEGIIRIDPDNPSATPAIFNDSVGVAANYIRELFEDRDGNIWGASFESGVVRISADGRVRRYTMADGLSDSSAWAITQTPDGTIIVGSARGGLAEIAGDSVRVISVKDGLPSNNIRSLALDSLGRLWVGTSVGLLAETGPGTRMFVNRPALLGSGASIIGALGNGIIWYHVEKYLTVYDSRAESLPPADAPVYLTSARVNGGEVPLTGLLELSHDQSTIELQYVGLAYGVDGGPAFRYRLVGADDSWQGPTKNRSITFGHLDPGAYTFEVVAVGSDGADAGKPATMSIIIAPAYWQRWWFVAICVCLLAGSGIGVARMRTARYRREQQVAEDFSRQLIGSQERERKRLAGELHDELGQELLVMINRAQMGLRADSLEKAQRQLEEVSEAGARAIEEVRNMAFNLRPYHLEQLGLTESLKSMIGKVAGSVQTKFTVAVDPVDGLVAPADEINVFRIVQECLNNIVKHSSAGHAEIAVRRNGDRITIRVRDDGKGISEKSGSTARAGFGLPGIGERVKLLNGTITVTSKEGEGTMIEVNIPRNSPKSDRGDQ